MSQSKNTLLFISFVTLTVFSGIFVPEVHYYSLELKILIRNVAESSFWLHISIARSSLVLFIFIMDPTNDICNYSGHFT